MIGPHLDASAPRVESTPAIDVAALHAKGWLQAGDAYLFFDTVPRLLNGMSVRVEVSQADTVALTLVGRASDHPAEISRVTLVVRDCRFGGSTCLARCCRCERVVRYLYVGADGIACRACLGLRYESQYVAARWRALTRAQQRRFELGGEADMTKPFPARPRCMRQARYMALREKETADLAAWIEQAWPGGCGTRSR